MTDLDRVKQLLEELGVECSVRESEGDLGLVLQPGTRRVGGFSNAMAVFRFSSEGDFKQVLVSG